MQKIGLRSKALRPTVAVSMFALGVAIFAPAATAAPIGEISPPWEAPLKIVAFGSSSTEGVGATNPSSAYPARLQVLLNDEMPDGRRVEVVNRGVGGEDADDMIRRLPRDVIARHPAVVIWQTGSNDPFRKVPLERFERETRDGIAAMQKAGIKVILMEPQWCPRLEQIATASDYRDMVRRIGHDMGIDVVRRSDLMHDWIREGLLTRREMLAPDGLHMTDGGYAALARSVAPEVLKTEDIGPKRYTDSGAIGPTTASGIERGLGLASLGLTDATIRIVFGLACNS